MTFHFLIHTMPLFFSYHRLLSNILFAFFFFFSFSSYAARITGVVTNDKGEILPYASISIKGTTRGVNANNEGKYILNLSPGSYTLVCQYVGYKREEKDMVVASADIELDFILRLQDFVLKEVLVKQGEDPAYEIIRQAIKKRPYYKAQLNNFQCEVYTKGQLKLRDYPNKLMGRTVDFEDGDTSKQKIVYLSETVAKYSVQQPAKARVEVISSKVSGQSDGFGLSTPQIYSFYENNVSIANNSFSSRGFISPVADNALNYYRYKYEGDFSEDGKLISRVRVIPKRKYEPLFSGYINIVDGDWRIHSIQLMLTKESQIEIIDTLRLEQLYVPFTDDVWVVKSQVMYPSIKILGFDAYGSFVNVYSDFNINPDFEKGFFGNTIVEYLDSSNKKNEQYWEETRPVPLQLEEINDYKRKDSIEQAKKDPRYLDSLDRIQNKVGFGAILLSGKTVNKRKNRTTYTFNSLLNSVSYNTVEGLALELNGSFTKKFDSSLFSRRYFSVRPNLRYGFSNKHLNADLTAIYNFGKKYTNTLTIQGGKKVFQFNNDGPVYLLANSISTLYYTRNHLKIYEAWIGRVEFARELNNGLSWDGRFEYQDRLPLENTTAYKWRTVKGRTFSPNYPEELMQQNFLRHQAFTFSTELSWQPRPRYIEFPDRKINMGSKYPLMTVAYTQAINNIFGSDVKYSKWRFSITDDISMKLAGSLGYRLVIGGFINRDSVNVQDYTHYKGNRYLFTETYLNSFQLAPYYRFSNQERFYTTAHIEYHLNGFLTNKLPVFRKLNWFLVIGSNALHINRNTNYMEAFAGLENILKVIRIDFVRSWMDGSKPVSGIRFGLRGAFGN